jgi:hypothetical protein
MSGFGDSLLSFDDDCDILEHDIYGSNGFFRNDMQNCCFYVANS